MKRIVVKIGTKVLATRDSRLDEHVVQSIVGQICELLDRNLEVLIVSSGAIGAGLGRLNIKRVPQSLAKLQAIASVGQNALMNVYNKYFSEKGFITGQILLTQDDFDDRVRYLNIKYTINTLLSYKTIPIINENDTIRTDEIKCGDNDRLSSLVADLSGADTLIMLTDVDGLMDERGKCVIEADKIKGGAQSLIIKKTKLLGTGGMETKIAAAEFCQDSGIECYIANGKTLNVLLSIVEKKGLFTHFSAKGKSVSAKKRWIKFGSKTRGFLIVDDGAKDALLKRNKSLLSAGIVRISGHFKAGDIVEVRDTNGCEFAKGVTNYSSGEMTKIMGKKTAEIKSILGYKDHDEVVHKDNMVILTQI